jgi:DNA-binding MarR family transcriptional regulator
LTIQPPIAALEAPASAEVELGLLKDVVGFRIRRIQNHLSRGFAERVNRKDVRPGLFSALALISANPGLSQTTLAREIGFDKATVVALLDALEKLGWARRKRVPDDRRRYSLRATPKGEEALAKLMSIAIANEEVVRTTLKPGEIAVLFTLLDRLYAACLAADTAGGG